MESFFARRASTQKAKLKTQNSTFSKKMKRQPEKSAGWRFAWVKRSKRKVKRSKKGQKN
jgi:hypothetical protein